MGKNWAITVGINQYHNLKPLQYAQRDAEAIQNFCLNEAKFEWVYHFAEGAPLIPVNQGSPLRSEPTLGNLERFLRVRFEQPFLAAGDNLWFFFAGHGKRHRGRDYLMPIDGDPGNVERTGIAIRDVADRLRRSGADNVVLLLDACRGEDDRDGGAGIGTEQQQGVITLFACSPNELSYEIEELQQGTFTHCLLQGLRIAGENNCATVERLYQHLRYQVPELNRRYRKAAQYPYAIAEPATKLHLILLPQYATLQDVMALKNDALEAEAEADLDLAEQLWIRVLGASPADLQAVKAIGRIALRRRDQPAIAQTVTVTSAASSRDAEASEAVQLQTFKFEVVTVDARGEITNRQTKQAEFFAEDFGNGITLEMVKIPGGSFKMGSPETKLERHSTESPQHIVDVPSFFMGKFAITQAQYQKIMGSNSANFKSNKRPVEQVSWNDAVEFCSKLSKQTRCTYRLPNEAEWEYSCRAGTMLSFHFGATVTTDLANYQGTDWVYQGKTYSGSYGDAPKGKFREQTTDVGTFPPNAFGLYDMHGNVWEWCQDHWHDDYQGAPTNGSAWLSEDKNTVRVLRGGSWCDDPWLCRSATRVYDVAEVHNSNNGFRVVCSAPRTL
ncbi:MAG: SUMF1/EgtB/PvdO family nonheme iron enzyme [Pegethrix bostrychoides GSE-TBD4-15B]|uniref:SUMF1/EgtB/PvdO family nonheme iron enzyme n=1 Tax=Pegethrix bostrychoides GSE-TBD4-15B TaxID=2839662 RepID=A0A951U2T0_9CYAN|nr:SUMF1/EgtB/PvdO family nonheme iron enzyme [Pegethrix bostrychoides GSE-TBD4-15B]